MNACSCTRPVPVTPKPPEVECLTCGVALGTRVDLFALATSIANRRREQHIPHQLKTSARDVDEERRVLLGAVWTAAFRDEIFYVMVTRNVEREEDLGRPEWESILNLTRTVFRGKLDAWRKEREEREQHKTRVGDHTTIEVNQGQRDAMVLAVIGDEALLEYEMPRGSTALWIIDAYTWAHKRNVSYRALPFKWIAAMHADGVEWTSRPQGSIKRRYGLATFELRYHTPSIKERYAQQSPSEGESARD